MQASLDCKILGGCLGRQYRFRLAYDAKVKDNLQSLSMIGASRAWLSQLFDFRRMTHSSRVSVSTNSSLGEFYDRATS